ncbi:zinc-ribbon metal-binding protein lunapark [Dermatophagoides pteronyssinus]|uniref:zinc-ribbon metal-binding protein lunapark n=1 Tax=Dermatophagoides pteronyssinus TaxID=6956 RepID=UPI003F67B0AF
MGNLLYSSKKKNAKEQLEDIQEEIYQIDKYKLTSFLRQKNYLALVYFLFILIYPTGLVYIYFTFDSNNNRTQILYSLLFIISLPIFVYLFRKYLHLYFKWITDNNNIRLVQLLKEKKKILSKVQETETFNDAKCILEKYDPSLLRNLSLSLNNLSQIDNAPTTATTPIRDRRTSTFSHQQQQSQQTLPSQNNNNLNNRLTSPIRNYNPNRITGQSLPPQMNRNYMTQQPQSSSTTSNQQQPGMINISATPMIGQRTIKPILPQNRSTVEKVIDYMFNDGPNNRYALICPHCLSHNGMALPDEFEYIAYICAYCGTFNPSRKIRPAAPSQQQQSQQPQTQQKAIEPPPTPPSPTSSSKPGNLKIVELSSVLNKTMDSTINKPTVEEPSDDHHKDNDQKSKNDRNERIRSIDSSSDEE